LRPAGNRPFSSINCRIYISGYDAFGEFTGGTGSTQNKYLFAGEQCDAGLGDYYLRQRFYDASSGRFTRQDTFSGRANQPLTLHKYIYGSANPVNRIDPTGYEAFALEQAVAAAIFSILAAYSYHITLGSYHPEPLKGFGEDSRPRTVLDGLWAWKNTWTPEPLGGFGEGSQPSVPSHTGRSIGDINDFVRYIFSIHIDIAYDIAYGHAWPDHRADWTSIQLNGEQEVAEHIENIMLFPSDEKSSGNRKAYWDEKTGTIVIENPADPDGGTAFRPKRGKEYFNDWPNTP
jgi:RHS repeat-associated protein